MTVLAKSTHINATAVFDYHDIKTGDTVTIHESTMLPNKIMLYKTTKPNSDKVHYLYSSEVKLMVV